MNKAEFRQITKQYKTEIKALKNIIDDAKKHKTKAQIIIRDGNKCRLCGSSDYLEVHHMLPKSLGGRDDNNNRITVCASCHLFMHCNPALIKKQKELHASRTKAGLIGKSMVGKRGKDKKQRVLRSYDDDKLLALL